MAQGKMHFDDVVETYDRLRPEYPSELFADIFDYAGGGSKAIEIGAGTGKATSAFLDAGYDVTAIEIGANMVAFLQDRFAQNGKFRAVCVPFEDADLPENAYDLIYAATAFHWVNPETGCPKALRLLKSGGAFAIFRYTALPGDGERYDDIQAVYDKYYHQPNKRPTRLSDAEYGAPAELVKAHGVGNLGEYGFADVTVKHYHTTKTFSVDEYMNLLDTFPDHKSLNDSDRANLYAGVREAIERHGGQHEVEYLFRLYMGRKA